MSDMEQKWKPNGRPQSIMAQAFSSTLDSVFALDSEVDHLSQSIDQKRFQMIIQTRELEELQAKIRATEARLKARQSIILDGNSSMSSAGVAKEDNGYRSRDSSTSTATSPTDTAGQYSSSDEQQGQDRNRKS